MKNNQYRLSFTGASFFLFESIELTNLYFECSSWDEAIDSLLSSSVLKKSTSTVRRESREISLRLKNLSDPLLKKFIAVNPDDVKIILLYAIIKTYPVIKAFCLEVLYEKMLIMDNTLQEYEINAFFRKQEEANEALDKKADATKKKLKQVMIKILADADILTSTKEKSIIKPYIDTGISRMILEDSDESYLKALLMNDSEIAMLGAIR